MNPTNEEMCLISACHRGDIKELESNNMSVSCCEYEPLIQAVANSKTDIISNIFERENIEWTEILCHRLIEETIVNNNVFLFCYLCKEWIYLIIILESYIPTGLLKSIKNLS